MKLTIRKKLIGSFLIIAFLLVITNGISSYYLSKIDRGYSDLLDRQAIVLSNVQQIQVEVAKENSRLRGYMITRDQKYLTDLQTSYDNVTRLTNETLKITNSKSFEEELRKIERINKEFRAEYEKLIEMIQSNRHENEVTAFFKGNIIRAGRQLDPIAERLANIQLEEMASASQYNSEVVKSAVANVALLSIVAVVMAILIGYFISQMISRPIAAMAAVTKRIASGDLTAEQIRVKNRDEIGAMAQSFNQMSENLRDLVRKISISSEHVASSSEELTASAEQSSQASETVSLTIQQVSASSEMQSTNISESVQAINEMSSGIQQIASSANLTSTLSVQASQRALKGNEAIQLSVRQMDLIHQTMDNLSHAVTEMDHQSQEIERIVEVITDISAQTNLLALNAAIEAARAGEQGRGFAVVADEVRKLAEQSAQSAGQIAQLVATIKGHSKNVVESMEAGVSEVDEGIRVVHTAGKLFDEIRRNIDEVSNQVQEISAASQQISASTEEVVHSFDRISEGSKMVAAESQTVAASTEEQLASMEEIASSASSLSKMAEELQNEIAKFKV